ncbi:pentatricopeptide repeat-containing protein At5g06540-like isoform X3 [Rhododendron vialii]|uniref:pentatricopeptide repeat-containing protein At5g06540-like isoform X3 n=1 Tax=Rhododendron vialii TaxID=182163 RepID=UPI00265F24F7|nr:pentatricopeptide repeat-containing protein At5g06540-like isoform X3 [Rhododendron vialii]
MSRHGFPTKWLRISIRVLQLSPCSPRMRRGACNCREKTNVVDQNWVRNERRGSVLRLGMTIHRKEIGVMKHITAIVERWDGVEELRRCMNNNDLLKKPGWSCDETEGLIHGFAFGDQSHPQMLEIYEPSLECHM